RQPRRAPAHRRGKRGGGLSQRHRRTGQCGRPADQPACDPAAGGEGSGQSAARLRRRGQGCGDQAGQPRAGEHRRRRRCADRQRLRPLPQSAAGVAAVRRSRPARGPGRARAAGADPEREGGPGARLCVGVGRTGAARGTAGCVRLRTPRAGAERLPQRNRRLPAGSARRGLDRRGRVRLRRRTAHHRRPGRWRQRQGRRRGEPRRRIRPPAPGDRGRTLAGAAADRAGAARPLRHRRHQRVAGAARLFPAGRARHLAAAGGDTMTAKPDRLYDLLPVVYRLRDAEQGYPLRDFLRVLSAQADVLEQDIARLYDNWFIETCDDWLVPYIGDLLGYSLLPEAAALGEDGHCDARLGRVLAPRADVANTIDARRRKGTLSLLEDLARDAAGWPARAVEFRRRLGWMQHLDHQHPRRGGTADLRDPGRLQRIAFANGAFDPFAHSVDVRRLGSRHRRGRWNIPAVGVFACRLRSYPVTRISAYCVEEQGPHCFSFSVLGNDTLLFQRPVEETAPTHIAEERNLPLPLRRWRFAERGPLADYAGVSPDLYGDGRSVEIWAPDWPTKGQGMPVPR